MVTSATGQIKDLTDQITNQQEQLQHADVVETLKKALSALFKLATSDKDAKTQLSVILGLASDVINGSFDSLFKDAARLKTLIAQLQKLRDTLTDVKAQLRALSSSLRNTMAVTDVLNDVWITVGGNLKQLSDYQELLTPQQQVEVGRVWTSTIAIAQNLVSAISGARPTRRAMVTLSAQPKSALESSISLPKTSAELAIFQAIEEGGMHNFTREESVQQRVLAKALEVNLGAAPAAKDPTMEEFMENFKYGFHNP